jgi:hypothetical protein
MEFPHLAASWGVEDGSIASGGLPAASGFRRTKNKKAGSTASGLLNFLPELGRSVAVTFFYGLA